MDREKYMSADEVGRLRTVTEAAALTAARRGRVRGVLTWALVDTALQTGLRVSELARLTIGDVDLRRRGLRAWRHKRREPLQETIAISPELAKHLREFIEWKKAVEQPVEPDSHLFHGKRGPLSAQGLQQIWKRAIAEAGLPAELSIHSARHTLAVHLLKKTGNLRIVQKQLGHASPTVTANMYADVSFEDMADAVTAVYE